jgi:hypothetical protein
MLLLLWLMLAARLAGCPPLHSGKLRFKIPMRRRPRRVGSEASCERGGGRGGERLGGGATRCRRGGSWPVRAGPLWREAASRGAPPPVPQPLRPLTGRQ